MMTRTERLKFCVVCKNRQMDINQGIICSLTKEYATFENECPNYIADETAIAKEAEKQKQLENIRMVGFLSLGWSWLGRGVILNKGYCCCCKWRLGCVLFYCISYEYYRCICNSNICNMGILQSANKRRFYSPNLYRNGCFRWSYWVVFFVVAERRIDNLFGLQYGLLSS